MKAGLLSSLIPLMIFLLLGNGTFGIIKKKANAEIPDKAQSEVEIIVLMDNHPFREDLEKRWGFSCLVRGTEKTILFDTGPSAPALLRNMKKMDVDPKEVDVVVLSHIHSDHTGGLDGFLQVNADVVVYLPASFPESIKAVIHSHGADFVEVSEPLKICADAYSSGEIKSGLEQSLIVYTAMGTVVITGCAHPGIVNILKKNQNLKKANLLLVMGGFHLLSEYHDTIKHVVSSFKELGVRYVGLGHCSGNKARKLFEASYRSRLLDIGVGRIIKLNDLT
ncbi:MBL fold metallo-hydrolase [Thermodesulfobacteriota bacterium]